MLKLFLKFALIAIIIILGAFLFIYFSTYIRSSVLSKTQSYEACGCGCCGGAAQKTQCLYKAQGDNLQSIIQKDLLQRNNPSCSMMGCSQGTVYQYCD